MLKRRHLPAVFAALAAPRGLAAQSRRWHRLAIVTSAASDAQVSDVTSRYWRAFFDALRGHGYQEARDLIVERWSRRGDGVDYAGISREIADSRPDVIYMASTRLARAMQAATTEIPIVIAAPDIVESGIANSLHRPGRNATGLSVDLGSYIWRRWLDLLREAAPGVSRMALLVPRSMWDDAGPKQVREIATQHGVTLIGALTESPLHPGEYQRAFSRMGDEGVEGLIVGDAPGNFAYRHLIVEAAAANRFPMMVPWRELAELGAFISYGVDLAEKGRQAAGYVALILGGAKPADTEIRRFDKFELVINARTARRLDLAVPSALMARAAAVIE